MISGCESEPGRQMANRTLPRVVLYLFIVCWSEGQNCSHLEDMRFSCQFWGISRPRLKNNRYWLDLFTVVFNRWNFIIFTHKFSSN